MAPPVRFLLGGDLGSPAPTWCRGRGPSAAPPLLLRWRGIGAGLVTRGCSRAGDTGQRALATPAQGRAPGCVLPALSAFLLRVLSPPSILTPHWPLVAPLRLGPGGCGRPGWYSPGRGAARQPQEAPSSSDATASATGVPGRGAREQSLLTELKNRK